MAIDPNLRVGVHEHELCLHCHKKPSSSMESTKIVIKLFFGRLACDGNVNAAAFLRSQSCSEL